MQRSSLKSLKMLLNMALTLELELVYFMAPFSVLMDWPFGLALIAFRAIAHVPHLSIMAIPILLAKYLSFYFASSKSAITFCK
jgi:hypothetical protein